MYFNMEQDRQQGIGRARGQGIHQRGGHGYQQRGQRGGHGNQQRGQRGGHGHQQRGQRGGHGHQKRGQRGGYGGCQRVGHQRERGRTVVSNEVRAIIIDHVVNRGLTMAEAARLVDPNLNCKFYHPNFSPRKPVSVEDIYCALPLHLQ